MRLTVTHFHVVTGGAELQLDCVRIRSACNVDNLKVLDGAWRHHVALEHLHVLLRVAVNVEASKWDLAREAAVVHFGHGVWHAFVLHAHTTHQLVTRLSGVVHTLGPVQEPRLKRVVYVALARRLTVHVVLAIAHVLGEDGRIDAVVHHIVASWSAKTKSMAVNYHGSWTKPQNLPSFYLKQSDPSLSSEMLAGTYLNVFSMLGFTGDWAP